MTTWPVDWSHQPTLSHEAMGKCMAFFSWEYHVGWWDWLLPFTCLHLHESSCSPATRPLCTTLGIRWLLWATQQDIKHSHDWFFRGNWHRKPMETPGRSSWEHRWFNRFQWSQRIQRNKKSCWKDQNLAPDLEKIMRGCVILLIACSMTVVDEYGGFQLVITGYPQSSSSDFERWDFPSQKPSSELG